MFRPEVILLKSGKASTILPRLPDGYRIKAVRQMWQRHCHPEVLHESFRNRRVNVMAALSTLGTMPTSH